MRLPRRGQIDFVGKKYIWFGISGVVILVSVIALFTRGLNFGVDFTGGTQIDIKCKEGISIAKVRKVLSEFNYGDAQIQQAKGGAFILRTPKLDGSAKDKIISALKAKAGLVEVLGINDVGPGWGAQVSRHAAIGVCFFIIAVVIYVSFRFEFKMAICAIIEIIHDLIITVGVYALVGREVTPATVIAVLTILGYSLYDAIVIFDRIKENADQLTRQSKKTYTDIVNDSINQVLARSVNTSLTTLFPIVTILLFGGETLKAFAFALFLGVLSGTYSSIFLASPILSAWKEAEPKYAAFRQRVERAKAKSDRPQLKVESQTEFDSRVEPVLKQGRSVAEKEEPPETKVKATKPGPHPKPKQKAGVQAQKASAKSRTKGPGSKKKKKKRR